MKFSIYLNTINLGWSIVYIEGKQEKQAMITKTVSYNNCISLSEDRFCLKANIVDPDEMPHNAAFHMGDHCLPLYPFMGYLSTKS